MQRERKKVFVEERKVTHKKSEEGWAILSTMIAIVVGLIMLAGIFAIIGQAIESSRIQNEQQNIASIRLNVANLFSGQPNYEGLSSAVAKDAGVFPAAMIKGAAVKNAWNGDVLLAAGTPATQFTITYTDVPRASCIRLAVFGYGQWERVLVGGTEIPQVAGAQSAPVVAASACQDNNQIVWTAH